MAIVLLIQHREKVSKLPMTNKTVTFGRSSKSDVTIKDKMMSGQHFSITLTKNEILTIKDLESTNGTYLNGSTITSSKLFIGDQVTVGETSIQIDVSSLNKQETKYFTNEERTTVRFIKPPKGQKTLSIKRDIYEEFSEEEAPKKEAIEKPSNKTPDISINFSAEGSVTEKPKDEDVTVSEVIKGDDVDIENIDKGEYKETGETKFIKLDKETLTQKKHKASRARGGTGVHTEKKRKKRKIKKKQKKKSLIQKIFGIFGK
jgi:pSer/pThr/pTyr-binding forkhead associated (FHA) protein